ncbi:MAG: TonB family protein [Candidatus Fermentibacteraceae bacterium]|nr:TonB family protein [Candidatus Fermentibacteraceae bacterium]MBN2608972.1 TonB family protein [Candidatus Fermentibacteraceae bacterium]
MSLLISLSAQTATVDEAIELYLTGDMNGSISSLESLLDRGELTLDEEIRVYHRLGAAYFGIGQRDMTESSFYSLLLLDPYYDLGPWENPQLREILSTVRQESMATVLIEGEPQGALVFMAGQYLGSTPYTHDNLIGGRTYTFTMVAEGYRTTVQSCSTTPGQLHTMMYQMDPLGVSSGVAYADTAASSGSSGQGTAGQGGIEVASGGSPAGSSVLPDTAASGISGSSGNLGIEQLNAILHGGGEMAALGDVGPLNTNPSGQEAAGSGQGLSRDPTIFQNTGGTIETVSENTARMVFSDVNLENDMVLQTDPGSAYSSRTSNEVREVLASKESAVTFIYNKHLRLDPLLSGTVVIEMLIEPSGRVSNVTILDSNTMNPAFDLELASTVETWRFGAVDEDEGPLPVTYPFSFSR